MTEVVIHLCSKAPVKKSKVRYGAAVEAVLRELGVGLNEIMPLDEDLVDDIHYDVVGVVEATSGFETLKYPYVNPFCVLIPLLQRYGVIEQYGEIRYSEELYRKMMTDVLKLAIADNNIDMSRMRPFEDLINEVEYDEINKYSNTKYPVVHGGELLGVLLLVDADCSVDFIVVKESNEDHAETSVQSPYMSSTFFLEELSSYMGEVGQAAVIKDAEMAASAAEDLVLQLLYRLPKDMIHASLSMLVEHLEVHVDKWATDPATHQPNGDDSVH